MDGHREYNAKQSKPVRERQIPYDFTHMCNLKNKTNEQRKKKKNNQKPKNRGEVARRIGEIGEGD